MGKGQSVGFTAYLDSQGRCQAKDLKAAGKKDKTESEKEKKGADEEGGEIGEFVGEIESRGPKFGFVKCEELEGEGKAFILGKELKSEHKVGLKVRFTAYLDSQGRCKGKDLKVEA